MQNVNNFLVTCHGWSGSSWLATALNKHKDILCTHSAANVLPDSGKGYSKEEEKISSEARSLKLNTQQMQLSDYFKHQEALGNAKLYGSVHTYRLRDIPKLVKNNTSNNLRFNVVNLVRHPVNLVASGQGQFTQMIEFDIFARVEVLNFFTKSSNFYLYLREKYNLDLCNWDTVCFLAAAQHMFILSQEQALVKGVVNFKMEDLTTTPDLLKRLIKLISSDQITVNEEYLDDVYNLGKINIHKKGKKIYTCQEQFELWSDWQKEAFVYFFKESKIENSYKKIGYDFSFLSAEEKNLS